MTVPSLEPVDVVVVGAGLSGLVAAHRLRGHGLRVRVLEARERVGGRLVTATTPSGATVDLGGQWGGASHHGLAALVQQLGLATFPSHYDGLGLFHWHGKACSAPIASDLRQSFLFFEPDALPLNPVAIAAARRIKAEFDGLVAQVPPLSPWTMAAAERLDRQTIASWMEARSDHPIAQLPLRWLALVGGSGGFEPAESSILHLAWTQAVAPQEENPESWLVHGGMGQVPQRLAQQLGESVVQLGNPVVAINQDANAVRVHGADGCGHQAAVAIVAIPPPLRSGIRFEPDLPPEQRALLQRSPMGCMAKWLAVYARPFWREQGQNGLALGDLPWLDLVADSSPPCGTPAILAGFVAGPRAIRLGQLAPAQRRAAVLADLEACWGPEAARPLDLIEQDWTQDSWSTGAFTTYLSPGAWTGFGPAWRQGHGRVLWAGTEMATRWPGYGEGAILAGEEAADQALALVG
jgi:monoamine oxidase